MEQEFCMNILDWVEAYNQLVLMFEEHENCLSEMKTMLFWMKTVLKESHV